LRNIGVHNYDGLQMDKIWEIATKESPILYSQIKDILENDSQEEE